MSQIPETGLGPYNPSGNASAHCGIGMSQIPETGLGPTVWAASKVIELPDRNEPDTGNGIGTPQRKVLYPEPQSHRNEPDTGNGIGTISKYLSFWIFLQAYRNEPDTGNGIGTWTVAHVRCA